MQTFHQSFTKKRSVCSYLRILLIPYPRNQRLTCPQKQCSGQKEWIKVLSIDPGFGPNTLPLHYRRIIVFLRRGLTNKLKRFASSRKPFVNYFVIDFFKNCWRIISIVRPVKTNFNISYFVDTFFVLDETYTILGWIHFARPIFPHKYSRRDKIQRSLYYFCILVPDVHNEQ